MRKVLPVLLLGLMLLSIAGFAGVSHAARPAGIVIAVDMSHGQNPGGLVELMHLIPEADWVIIVKTEDDIANLPTWVQNNAYEIRAGGITTDNLNNVDMLIIGQPTELLTPDEVNAITAWFNEYGLALWVAADSDYPAQGSEIAQQAANQVLEALGAHIRVDYVSVEDSQSYAGKTYRVVGIIDPPAELSFLKWGARKMLFHGPGVVYAIDDSGNPVNPITNPLPNVYVLVRTSEGGEIVEHQPKAPGEPGNVGVFYQVGQTGEFPLLVAENLSGKIVIASGESPYSGYQAGITWIYYGVVLQGPQFFKNLVYWATGYMGPLMDIKELYDQLGGISDLQSSISSIQSSLNSLETTVSNLQSTINSLSSDVDSLSSKVNNLDSTVSSLSNQISQLQSDLSSLQDTVNSLSGVGGKADNAFYIGIVAIILALIALAIPFVKK